MGRDETIGERGRGKKKGSGGGGRGQTGVRCGFSGRRKWMRYDSLSVEKDAGLCFLDVVVVAQPPEISAAG